MKKGSRKKEPVVWNYPDKWLHIEKLRDTLGLEAFEKLSDNDKDLHAAMTYLAELLVEAFLDLDVKDRHSPLLDDQKESPQG